MNKLASLNYDITDHLVSGDTDKIKDVSQGLSKEARSIELPDFEEQQERPVSDFALITEHSGQGEMKKFARYNKELTEVNLNLLESKKDELPEEIVKIAAHNLVQAAHDFGLEYEGDLNEYFEKDAGYVDPRINLSDVDQLSYRQKIAEVQPTQKWALPSLAKYPIETENQIKDACTYFEKNANQFEPLEAVEYALNVKQAAEDRGDIEVSPTIEKFASVDSEFFNEDLPAHIDVRKSYLTPDQDQERELYNEFTKKASELKPSKAARLLESIDKEAQLDRSWGKGIENPITSVMSIQMDKTANAGPTLQDLRNLDNANLTPIVGNETISELKGEDGVAVYKSLPVPIKREVDALLKSQ